MGANVSTLESSSLDTSSSSTGGETTSSGGTHGLAGTTYEEGQAADAAQLRTATLEFLRARYPGGVGR